MGDDFMFQLFGKYRDMALAVKNQCHLNMAACQIKLKRYDEAIMQCSIVSMQFHASWTDVIPFQCWILIISLFNELNLNSYLGI